MLAQKKKAQEVSPCSLSPVHSYKNQQADVKCLRLKVKRSLTHNSFSLLEKGRGQEAVVCAANLFRGRPPLPPHTITLHANKEVQLAVLGKKEEIQHVLTNCSGVFIKPYVKSKKHFDIQEEMGVITVMTREGT